MIKDQFKARFDNYFKDLRSRAVIKWEILILAFDKED